MVSKNEKTITVIEATAIIISTIIGVGVLALPRLAAEAGNSGAPLVTLIGILLSWIGICIVALLGLRFPNQSIVEYSERLVGKWLARTGSGIIILFFVTLTAMTAREFGKVIVTSLLSNTPLIVTTGTMLVLAAIVSRANMTTFAYSHLFYLPFVFAPGLIMVMLSTKDGNLLNLQPIVGNEPHMAAMMSGAISVSALFQGAFVISFVIPAMRRPEKALVAGTWGVLVSGGLYLLIVVATIAVFGPEATKLFLWPTLELAKTTMLPGEVLERLDAPFLIVWVTAVFTTLYSTYIVSVRAIKDLCRLSDHKMISLFVLPFIFLVAMLPPNVVQLYRFISFMSRTGLWITMAYPAVLLIVALITRQRDGNRATP